MALQAGIVVQNFKVGSPKPYGLDHEGLIERFPLSHTYQKETPHDSS